MRVALRSVVAPLRFPLRAAHGVVRERELLLLELRDGERGPVGFGEAAALESYDGIGSAAVRAALRACAERLREADLATVLHPVARGSLLGECARRAPLAQARAAIELALLDLAGRAVGEPVWRLLGATAPPPPLEVNCTLTAAEPRAAAREAEAARREGFGTVKVKVGFGDDLARVAAVREAAGAAMRIRLDANGAWDEREALARLRALAPFGIELCEEPVRGAEAIGALARRAPVALALDESAAEPAALERRRCTAICLKLARCGGISGLLRTAARAHELGYEVYLASTLDGPLGIAAALHAAGLIVPERACGLATVSLFTAGVTALEPRCGRIALPPGPGLGDGLIGFYER